MLLRSFISILVLCLAGCAKPDFGPDSIRGMLEGSPITLSQEQVTLTQPQVECGVQAELWDPPSDHVAKLTQKGRDLKFSDDVRLDDPEIRQPYSQVSGPFSVSVSDVSKLRDTDNGMKLADVKLGVVITDDCFTKPLPLMGIHKGKFSPDAPVVFRFQGSGQDWTLDKLVH